MRGLRSTIALVVVLAGLGAYIYFVTWKKSAEPLSKQDKVFAGVQTDKIDELKVTSDKGDVTTLKKDNGNWQLVAPVTARADEAEASGIANAVGQVEIVRVIDENPSDLKGYGLDMPRVEVDFKAAGDKDYRRLLIGEKSPTGADLFARRNDEKKVFLIPASQETTLNRSTFELRDKTLLKFERDKVDGVEMNAGGKTVQLAKDGAEWKITQPLQVRADYGAVEGLIGKLQTTADQVDRRRQRQRGRPEEIRLRQADRQGRPEAGQRQRDAPARRNSRRQDGLRPRRLQACGRHGGQHTR